MAITLNGTTGITTPAVTNEGAYTGDGVVFADATPSNTLVTTTGGNVGIGISSPTQKLHVSNTSGSIQARVSSDTDVSVAAVASGADSTAFMTVINDARQWTLRVNGAESDQFQVRDSTAGATRMAINSSGQVLIGTTTAPSGASYLNSPEITLYNAVNLTEYRQIYYSNSTKYLYFTNGSNSAYLSNTGAWTNASDGRLKNSIVDIAHGLDSVMATQPRSFKFNETEGDYVGFIAQELQTVIPEVVSGDPETQLGVDYGSLVAVAFKAIQEQQAIITDLKARIETLENK